MADYYPLIAKAITGLDKSTGEARRALYERARTALVTQLRGVVPALNESDITRERLALEEAIRKAEAEAARKSRFDPPPERRRSGELDDARQPAAPPRAPAPPAESRGNGPATPAAVPEALAEALTHPSKEESKKESRKESKKEPKEEAKQASNEGSREESKDEPKDESKDESLSGTAAEVRRAPRTPAAPRFNEGLKGFRDVVADAENLGQATAEGARSARQAYNAMPSPSPEFERIEPRLEPEGLRTRDRRPPPGRDPVAKREPSPRENVRKARDSAPRERMPLGLGRDTDSHDADPRPSNSRQMADFDMPSRIEPMRGHDFSPRDFGPASDFGGDAAAGMPHDGARMAARSRAEAPSDHEEDVQSLPLRPRGRLMI
jgi:hypothetical protein